MMRWVIGQLGRGKCVTLAKAISCLANSRTPNDPLGFILGDIVENIKPSEKKAITALDGRIEPMNAEQLAALAKISRTTAETVLKDLADRGVINSDPTREMFSVLPIVVSYLRRHD